MSIRRKKILIVSLSAGAGHIQAGLALQNTAKLHFPELICRHIDIADYITPVLKKATAEGYGFLASHLPTVWSSLFKLTDNKAFIKMYHTLTDYLKMLNSFEFLDEVVRFNPDHIITTNFLPAEILMHAMKKQNHVIPLTQIITDYGIHPMCVVEGNTDYVVSTHEMKEELIHTYAIHPSRILEFGIPVDPRFYEPHSFREIRSKYHLPTPSPIILILSGGKGMIKIAHTVKDLFSHISRPVTIFAIAGKNKKLFNQLSKLHPPEHITYRPLGWIDDIPHLMSASQVVISKPGGLTTTECSVAGVPLIAINPIPGQEEFNTNHIIKNGLGGYANNPARIIELTHTYLSQEKTKKSRPAGRPNGWRILNYISIQKSRPHTRSGSYLPE